MFCTRLTVCVMPCVAESILTIPSSNSKMAHDVSDACWPLSVMTVLQGSQTIYPTKHAANHPYPDQIIHSTDFKPQFVPNVFCGVAIHLLYPCCWRPYLQLIGYINRNKDDALFKSTPMYGTRFWYMAPGLGNYSIYLAGLFVAQQWISCMQLYPH